MNVYIVYDLDVWLRNPTNYFKFKSCLFGATSTVKNNDKEKYMNSSYGEKIDSAVSRSFDNDTARNIIILVLMVVHHLMLTISKIIF